MLWLFNKMVTYQWIFTFIIWTHFVFIHLEFSPACYWSLVKSFLELLFAYMGFVLFLYLRFYHGFFFSIL